MPFSTPFLRIFRLLLLGYLLASGAVSVRAQLPLRGILGIHDPSTLAKDGGTYFVFGTGDNVISRWSSDLRTWNAGQPVFPGGAPAWTKTAVSGFGGFFWAPDVAYFNGRYHLYYSCSNWGTIDSAIGVATSPSLTNPVWTDRGKVVQSDAIGETTPETDYTAYNCIDPSVLVEPDGRVWLIFGSYSSGILIREIDPATGKPLNSTSTLLANNAAGGGWGSTEEAAMVYRHGDYYYLFVNFGGCCSGLDSTYNIRVGRSASPTGPYFDREGGNLVNGGGTMLLESSRRYLGPGHAGILNDNGAYWFTYHYYDALSNGAPLLAVQELKWGEDGWPVLTGDWSAHYPFDVDAREHSGLYNGTLANGAAVVAEPGRGKVLALDGVSQHVSLPLSVANASTFSAWVKWNGGAAWQRIFDFGSDTSRYLFLTPAAGNGRMRFAIRNGGAEQYLDAPSALPANAWRHVAVTLDGVETVLYLDGAPVARGTNIDIRPWELLARSNYLGRSQFSADPYFGGLIDSVRIFGRALSAAEVAAIAQAPAALAHRYSFTSDARDPVGMAHGGLKGDASVANGALRLTGAAGGYLNLPGGLVSGSSALTVEAWATFGANGAWARLFDFGDINGAFGANFLYWTPRASSGTARLSIATGGGSADIFAPSSFNNTSAHLVWILDPANGYAASYVNGVLQSQSSGGVPPLGGVGSGWAFVGRSLFSADPWLNATVDELRLHDGRLTAQEIASSNLAGPDALGRPLVWTGSGNRVWSAAAANWTDGTAAAAWAEDSSALFRATGSGAIDLAASVQPRALVFGAPGYSISSTGNATITLGAALPNVFTAADAVVQAPLAGGGGLGKAGAARLELRAANTYLGDTVLEGGTLSLLKGGALYTSGYNSSAVVRLLKGSVLETDRWGWGLANGEKAGLGGLDYGPARLVLDGGVVRYSGGVAGNPDAYGPGFTLGAKGATLEAAKAGDLWAVKFDSRGIGTIVSFSGGTLTLAGAGNGLLDKVLPGRGSLVKTGAGAWTLGRANTFTGNATVSGGVLSVTGAGALYAGGRNTTAVLTVGAGGTLELDRWGYGPAGAYRTQALGGLDYHPARFVIDGGTVRYTGGAAGAPQNPAEAPYGPGFTIGAGGATLEAAKAGDTWTVRNDSRGLGPVASDTGGTLTLSGAGDGIFDKVLPGGGGLTKSGAGTWTLSRINTYGGDTTVLQGKLAFDFPCLADGSTLKIGSGAKVILKHGGSDTVGALQLAGTAVGHGIFDASHPRHGAYFEGAGSIVVKSPYQLWIEAYPGLSDSSPSADPDGDGAVNLMERALGGNPGVAESGLLPATDPAGPALSLVYRKAKAASELEFVVQESADLVTWTAAVGSTAILSDDGVLQTLRFTRGLGNEGRLFLRLRVTAP